ncbi:MAG: DNA polymerase/3'-5' exonuclease PolX [Elusimicrobia bacterium ADurb.Bin231]|nr:MAG: DNA polymerase/3'-5' exonuclease PolX [Elusimicrobia bacterium ADurb.Bin231]
MRNSEISKLLYEIAEFLALKGENLFKIRAYENAASNISSLTDDITEKIKNKEKIPGIGTGIREKIEEYISTGKIQYLENLKEEFPAGIMEIMSIQSIGPKKARLFYDSLGVKNISELKEAALQGRIRDIETLGIKTEENILKGIELYEKGTQRMLLSTALETAESIIAEIKNTGITDISEAGSLRRRTETVRDIDILCVSKTPVQTIEKFCSIGERVLAKGETKSSIITSRGIQADLRIVDKSEYGSALQYFTGSKKHNISLRGFAKEAGYKINEYGIFDLMDGRKIGGDTESEIYEKMHLSFIPPEMREDAGEIEAAGQGALPNLVDLPDILGDTHIHSKYSDGNMAIREIAGKAEETGYLWAGICDHSVSLKVANGVTAEILYKKIDEIRNFNGPLRKIKLLCGSETDILADGALDYPDEILKELDIVIAAIHTGFKQDERSITRRIIQAIKNKYVHIIAHPTGRLLNRREPYAVNLDEIIQAAADYGVALEINASPDRLDLPDIWCRKAKEKKVTLAIGTDSHSAEQLNYMKLGVFMARRGWLEKNNLLNCMDMKTLESFLKRRRK